MNIFSRAHETWVRVVSDDTVVITTATSVVFSGTMPVILPFSFRPGLPLCGPRVNCAFGQVCCNVPYVSWSWLWRLLAHVLVWCVFCSSSSSLPSKGTSVTVAAGSVPVLISFRILLSRTVVIFGVLVPPCAFSSRGTSSVLLRLLCHRKSLPAWREVSFVDRILLVLPLLRNAVGAFNVENAKPEEAALDWWVYYMYTSVAEVNYVAT